MIAVKVTAIANAVCRTEDSMLQNYDVRIFKDGHCRRATIYASSPRELMWALVELKPEGADLASPSSEREMFDKVLESANIENLGGKQC